MYLAAAAKERTGRVWSSKTCVPRHIERERAFATGIRCDIELITNIDVFEYDGSFRGCIDLRLSYLRTSVTLLFKYEHDRETGLGHCERRAGHVASNSTLQVPIAALASSLHSSAGDSESGVEHWAVHWRFRGFSACCAHVGH